MWWLAPLGCARLEVPAVVDPLFGPVEVRGAGNKTVKVLDGKQVIAKIRADADGIARWDGRTGEGWAEAGPYTVGGVEVTLVRAGFIAARLGGEREPLYFYGDRALQSDEEPVSALEAIDDGTVPLDFPEVASGKLKRRPQGTEPAAFLHGTQPTLTLIAASRSALGETGLQAADIEVEAEGWTVVSGAPLRPGEALVLQRNEPLPDTLGISEEEVRLAFLAGEREIGHQILPLRLYRLLDHAQFPEGGPRYHPWPALVEDALAALEGTPAEPGPVLDGLVQHVYFDLGLEYESSSGTSMYSEYLNSSWEQPHLYLSEFLDRTMGDRINCVDAANVLSATANMLGAPLDELVLDPAFELNYIQAIGSERFTNCPFGWGNDCGFIFHTMTVSPDGASVWDAVLALDGDEDPGAEPASPLLVQGLAIDDYFDRLVRAGSPEFHSQARLTFE